MNWTNHEIDHVKPICMFDISDIKQVKEKFNWRNTQALLKEIHEQKCIKNNFLAYRMHFIKSYQFPKLNEERLN